MKDDSLLSSHPIVVDVSSPAEITSVFDGISYSKVGYPPLVTLDTKKLEALRKESGEEINVRGAHNHNS